MNGGCGGGGGDEEQLSQRLPVICKSYENQVNLKLVSA